METQELFLKMILALVAVMGDGLKKFQAMLVALAEFVKLGLVVSFSKMSNGETRARLMSSDGSGYIRTTTTEESAGWQNSHFHKGAVEWYAVQSGQIAFAELRPDGDATLTIIKAGGTFQSQPNVPHNVYMFSGADVHTTKFGQTDLVQYPEYRNEDKGDWWSSSELDKITRDNRDLTGDRILDHEDVRIHLSEGGLPRTTIVQLDGMVICVAEK